MNLHIDKKAPKPRPQSHYAHKSIDLSLSLDSHSPKARLFSARPH